MSAQMVEMPTADESQVEPVHVVERTKDGRVYWVVGADPERKVVTLQSRTGRRRFVREASLLANYRPLKQVAA